MRRSTGILIATLISIGISACASKDTIIPAPKDDMKTIYDRHMNGIGNNRLLDSRSLVRRPMIDGDVTLSEYVRTEKNHLESRFKMLPNPIMFMFVSPHLAADSQVPIPGYLTEFRMWEQDHYALPGEISDMRSGFVGE